jgi:hypothetical protein
MNPATDKYAAMTPEQKNKAEAERIKKIKKWQGRLDKLAKRKTDPLTEGEFCDRHGLPRSRFNRNKNLIGVASEDKVNSVEAAFVKEGV